MSFETPTLSELVDQVQADFESRFETTGAVLRRSFVDILSRVLAGASYLMHGHIDSLGDQLFADKAEDQFLVRIASIFGLTKDSPTFAKATLTTTGTNGTVIPAGTIYVRSDLVEYTVDADATVATGSATVAVTARVAGADGTLTVGVVLTLQGPITGISSTATVTASTQDGSDEEDSEGLRTRLLARLRDPPAGGSPADLIEWAKEVSGVTRAWAYPRELGAGTAVVRFVRDLDGSLIPDAGEVAAVQAYIDARRPATALVTVAAPVSAPLNFTLAVTPNTTATRAAVTAELTDLISRVGEPGGTVQLSDIQTSARNAAGVTDCTVTVPAANVTHTTGQIATMGTVTFT